LDSITSIQDTDSQIGTEVEMVKTLEVMGTMKEEIKTMVEGHPVLVPPPLTTLPELCSALQPFFNLE
jgi:hypothetical protein